MRTTACTDTNVHVNTHTQLHTTYSAVWPVSQRCVQSINQTASMPINTVSEANAQNTDRRDRMLFWGTEEGRRGGEEEYLCRYLVYLTPSPPTVNVTGCSGSG